MACVGGIEYNTDFFARSHVVVAHVVIASVIARYASLTQRAASALLPSMQFDRDSISTFWRHSVLSFSSMQLHAHTIL